MRFLSSLTLTATLLVTLGAPVLAEGEAAPRVRIDTNHGAIVVELDPEKAPGTVANFLQYVKDGFYDGTIFHRVIPSFMIQGGGFTPDMEQKPTRDTIQNEADNGLKNERGTIAMARKPDPHSASAQFFINNKNNPALDHQGKSNRGWGYAVFGRVVEGMDVVDSISAVSTGQKNMFRDVPRETVLIEKISVIEATPSPEAPAEEEGGQG